MAQFAQRHYEALALVYRTTNPEGVYTGEELRHHLEQWRLDVIQLARKLAHDNDKFNLRRFLDACGMSEADARIVRLS